MDLNRYPAASRKGPRMIEAAFFAWRPTMDRRARYLASPRASFPEMFGGQHLGMTLYRGWNPILLAACVAVERLLAPRTLPFHWVQLQEDDGIGRFLYSLGEHSQYVVKVEDRSRRVMLLITQDDAGDFAGAIDRIVNEAERLSSEACLVCGACTARRMYFGRNLPLCLRHQPELLNLVGEEGLEGVWRRSVEWDEPGAMRS